MFQLNVPPRTRRGINRVNFVFAQVFKKMDGASVFEVFLNHWLIEENKATRAIIFQQRGKKLKMMLFMRVYVQQFWKWTHQLPFGHMVPRNLRGIGMLLGKSKTIRGVCKMCERNFMVFHLVKIEHRTLLFVECKEYSCRWVEEVLDMTV
jgi:hypothetical protein